MKFSTFWGTILTASIFLVVAKPVVAAVLKNNEPVVGAVRATSPIYRFTNFWESSNPVQQLRGEEHLFGANTGEKVLFDFRAEVRGFNPVFAIFDSSNRQVGFSQYPYFTFLPASSGYYKVIVMSKDPSMVPNRYSLRATAVSATSPTQPSNLPSAVPGISPTQPTNLPPTDGLGSDVAGFLSAQPFGEVPFLPATNTPAPSSNSSFGGGFVESLERASVSTNFSNSFSSPGGLERPVSQPPNSSNSTFSSPPTVGQNCRTYSAGTVMFVGAMAARYYTYCLLPTAISPTATPSIPASSNTVASPQPVNNSFPFPPTANPASLPAGIGNSRVESGGAAPANSGNSRPSSEFYPY
ncbi:MAG: hypothetical protein JGK24_14460 [Microcoleus sp. PH2017_29_MFU_D_A]|uniref:hypothetical protein n=1 Tax=unclassified Microcoleus TaxID=2642155 RepID=UPI001D9C337D|nr:MULTISPECIES: hypothetical protein [unclassified Microcoleus]MCC3507609.1 hypothetical protein [Microcoleus sp. PH2017_17_BER_D_A]MCC3604389.1 hypothetical protein [Microcoleus sp. PH2017_29_MFU_D_A]MCC3635245.1 hypothetical protein [Microcoleus sp. PH2017_37_MFU_D_B]